jgi:hypothetical protein
MHPELHLDGHATCAGQPIGIIVRLPGQYSLANHRNAKGKWRKFACRAVNISERAIGLVAPVIGSVGEQVMADIEHVGKIEGNITNILPCGFTMSIEKCQGDRTHLRNKIDWIENHKTYGAPDKRVSSPRFAPANPYSKLLLGDGTLIPCLIIDLSATGARISGDIDPELGTVLAVGTVVGRVVRRFDEGFALKFVEPQALDRVETMATVSKS